MCPGAVVGPSTGPIPIAPLFFRFTTDVALKHKRAVYIGEGSNIFYAVRILLSEGVASCSLPLPALCPCRYAWMTSSTSTDVSLPAS